MIQNDRITGTSNARQEHLCNPYHQRLLAALRQEQSSHLTVGELCRKAGVSRGTWYNARKDPHFAAAISKIGIKVGVFGARYLQEPRWVPTQQEQKLLDMLDILQNEEQKHIQAQELCRKASVSKCTWKKAMKKPPFVAEVEARGVKVGKTTLSHLEVCLATDPEEVLAKDIWDMRQLKPDYPKHMAPSVFKVDFTCIGNPILRLQVKRYFRLHFPRWKPKTFRTILDYIRPFLRLLPSEMHIGTLNRSIVERLLPQIYQLSTYGACMCLRHTRSMLDYMALSPNWVDPRPPRFLLLDEDIPSEPDTLPRPIPPDVLQQLDTLLDQAIQAMETAQQPPLLNAPYWDALLILRRTGMRFEDLAHLKAPDDAGRNGCLNQDSEGFWWIHLRHKINKASKDHMIPTRMSDGVIAAVRRQRERVKDISNHFDESYLFRNQRGILNLTTFQGCLTKLAPQLLYEGQPYVITPHQFRHTIATEMIDQGIDIYTVKEFLGHAQLATTERYVQIYLTSLKAKYDAYQARKQEQEQATSGATADQGQVVPLDSDTDGGSIESSVGQLCLSPLPNGIGNCAHLIVMHDPCPTPPHCPTCPKLRASKRHLPCWENKAANLVITIDALRANPAYARARQQHEQELQHTQKVIETIKQEGFWDGHIHNI